MTEHDIFDHVDRTADIAPFAAAVAGAEPFWPAGVLMSLPAGALVVTDEGDCGLILGVYTLEAMRDGTDDVVYLSGIPDVDTAVRICAYLANETPEGVDWHAWASQRIDDDGLALAD